ncbi:MAG TPA: class I SAM-dependent methyltransferase [Solirubrobacterales bacterium]|jgi:predicted O-methyltransferase YrrM
MNVQSEPTRFGMIHDAPVHMLPSERVLLYSMVFGVRPERCLEIGTLYGGSAMITVAALDDIGSGRLVCIDPEPRVTPEVWAGVEHRATLLQGTSPEILPEAERTAGGKFEMALIDGDHSHAGVVRDVVGVMEVLADGGYMLMHDAHYGEVQEGIDEVLREHSGTLVDCGMLSSASTPDASAETVEWGGIRVLRMVSDGVAATPPEPISAEEIEAARRAQAALADVTGSASWRMTAPLRAAKSALRRRR